MIQLAAWFGVVDRLTGVARLDKQFWQTLQDLFQYGDVLPRLALPLLLLVGLQWGVEVDRIFMQFVTWLHNYESGQIILYFSWGLPQILEQLDFILYKFSEKI